MWKKAQQKKIKLIVSWEKQQDNMPKTRENVARFFQHSNEKKTTEKNLLAWYQPKFQHFTTKTGILSSIPFFATQIQCSVD